MNIINKIFKISVIIIFANGIANSLTTKGTLVNKLKEKINPDVDESMFRFVLKAIRIVIYLIAGFLVLTELNYNINGLVAGLGLGSVIGCTGKNR